MAGPKVPREDLEKTPLTVRRYIGVLEDYIAQLENEVLEGSSWKLRYPIWEVAP